MNIAILRSTGYLVLFVISAFAFADTTETPELFTRVVQYHVTFAINNDGAYVEDRTWAITILKEQALARAKQTSISYSTSIQKAEVLEAYTRKADGRRVDSPKSNYQIAANSGKDKNAPAFSDFTTLSVIFPDVAVGDTVVFAYRLTATEPMFPKHFSVVEAFGKTAAYDDVRIKIDAPASMKTYYQVNAFTEISNTEKGGRKVIEWSWQNKNPVASKRRNFSVYEVEQEPGFAFSTFQKYAEIAEAYGVRARPKAAVTARIQKLADEIAKGKTAPRDVARALYDWVAVNIDYAGNCIGLGAVVPRDVDFVLDNRIGDCKDHATLLQALLAAKGIPSVQALVNSGSSYRLPKIPVVSMVNHVITYIPSMDIYADSTSADTPFGMLPFSDAGKPVLLVDGYKDGTRTPVLPIGVNQQIMKTIVKIQPDGSVNGEVSVNLEGMYAANARSRFRNFPKEAEAELVKNNFKSGGYIGSGTFAKEDPKALIDKYSYSAKFEVKQMLPLPGAGAFSIQPLFYNESPISHYVSAAIQDVEDTEVACSSGRSVEEYTYQFPEGVTILSVPENMKLANDFLSYSATSELKGNTLVVKRIFDDRTKGNVCSPALNREYKQFAQKVLQNVKSQVLYK